MPCGMGGLGLDGLSEDWALKPTNPPKNLTWPSPRLQPSHEGTASTGALCFSATPPSNIPAQTLPRPIQCAAHRCLFKASLPQLRAAPCNPATRTTIFLISSLIASTADRIGPTRG